MEKLEKLDAATRQAICDKHETCTTCDMCRLQCFSGGRPPKCVCILRNLAKESGEKDAEN